MENGHMNTLENLDNRMVLGLVRRGDAERSEAQPSAVRNEKKENGREKSNGQSNNQTGIE
jgi:hypothetical protein